MLETSRVRVRVRDGRGIAQVSDDQRDVIEASGALAVPARPAEEALDILDNVLCHDGEV
jgi:hypothetical protein